MSDISLSAGVRANLQSLQGIASLLQTSQERLATGKKVNSALDNPRNFFTAKGMSDRGSALKALQDGMSTAIQTVKAADNALNSMTRFLQSARSLAEQAQAQSTVAGRSETATNAVTNGTGATPQARALSATLISNGLADGDVITFSRTVGTGADAVTSTFDFTVGAASTVQDLRDALNASGVGTLSIEANGTLTFASAGAAAFTVQVDADITTGFLGFSAAQAVDGGAADGVTTITTSASTAATGVDYTSQVQELIRQFDNTQRDATFNGRNILAAGTTNTLTVNFNEDNTSRLVVQNQDMSTNAFGGLVVGSLTSANAQTFIDAVDSALQSIKSLQTRLGNDLTILQERDKFTTTLVNTLQTGADKLTLADQNEEAANVLALQTRQQLSQSALSLANQADQAVLQLLR